VLLKGLLCNGDVFYAGLDFPCVRLTLGAEGSLLIEGFIESLEESSVPVECVTLQFGVLAVRILALLPV
jgi:hypothetical protein